jgi:hypothetical protein
LNFKAAAAEGETIMNGKTDLFPKKIYLHPLIPGQESPLNLIWLSERIDKSDIEYVLSEEIDRYKQWIDDLQSGMYINCVYCGHRYRPSESAPAIMADVLKEHILQCPEHPMSHLLTALETVEAAYQSNNRYDDIRHIVIAAMAMAKGGADKKSTEKRP